MNKRPSGRAAVEVLGAPTPYKIRLNTADDVRLEMARVYREMRAGALEHNAGSKLVFVLGQIGRMIELSIVEHRVEQLEDHARGNRIA